MASKSKPESQQQQPQQQQKESTFGHEDNRDTVGPTKEDVVLPKMPPNEQIPPATPQHSPFPSKSPTPLMFTHSDLQRNVQQLVDDINAKRKRDADSLSEVRKALEMQINNSGNILEETLVGIYEENSKVIQEKLQEIFAALDRISNLERELSEFKQALGSLYQDLRDPK